MIEIRLDRPWLTAHLPPRTQCLSWAPHRPGFVQSGAVHWREVRDADLSLDFDVAAWLREEMAARGAAEQVGLLTSRDLGCFVHTRARAEGVTAECLATVGLGNAERVGTRSQRAAEPAGTINALVVVDTPLSRVGLIEAMSIAVQARTAAVLEAEWPLPTGHATGTGTDCIVMAAPVGDTDFAGTHTAVGEAIGRCVYDAVAAGVATWIKTEGALA